MRHHPVLVMFISMYLMLAPGFRCVAFDIDIIIVDTIRVHSATPRIYVLRATEFGVTVSVYDPDDLTSSIVGIYRGDSVEHRRLPLARVSHAALHNDTLYCALSGYDTTASLAIVAPDGNIRLVTTEVPGIFSRAQADNVTVVDGNVSLNHKRDHVLILRKGDDTLRYADRRGNASMIRDVREPFFLRDTTYFISASSRRIAYATGEYGFLERRTYGKNITIVDDSVRWIDSWGRCHSHSIHGNGSVVWEFDSSLGDGCAGRYGVLATIDLIDPRLIYRSFAGTTHVIRAPSGLDARMAVAQPCGTGWYNGSFYRAIMSDDSTMIVLRLREPDPSTSSVPDVSQRTYKRHDARCLSLSETRLLLEELRRADPATYCVDLLGTRLESFPLTAGPLIFVSGNETRVILVLPW